MDNVYPISSSSDAVKGAEPRIKIVSLGSSGVGKSCIIKRYCEGRFVPKYIPTIGIDYGVKRVDVRAPASLTSTTTTTTTTAAAGKIAVRVNFWDMSGVADYVEIRNEFYAAAEGVLLVYDVTDAASFMALDGWLKEMEKYANVPQRTTGTDEVMSRSTGKPVLVVVCANKVDDAVEGINGGGGSSSSNNNSTNSNSNMNISGNQGKGKRRVVTEAEGRRWAEEHGYKYFETSACTGMRVTEALETLFADVVAAFM